MANTQSERSFVVHTIYGPTELPGDVDDPGVHSAYTEGQCVALALELHKRTGYPLLAVLTEPLHEEMSTTEVATVIASELHHVLVRAPDGTVIDIAGSRPLREYLESIDPGFAADQYRGRDTDELTEEEFHDSECLCIDQCYPSAGYAVADVSAADLQYAVALGELPRPAYRAASYFAAQLVKKHALPRKVKVASTSRSAGSRLKGEGRSA